MSPFVRFDLWSSAIFLLLLAGIVSESWQLVGIALLVVSVGRIVVTWENLRRKHRR
jgi:lipid-A-disaccharide synthase-like uncharacterized protein